MPGSSGPENTGWHRLVSLTSGAYDTTAMSFIDRLNDVVPCNPVDYVWFDVDDIHLGMMTQAFADTLAPYSDVFLASKERVALSPTLQGHADRTRALAGVLAELRDQGMIPGWRNEAYPVSTDFHAPTLFDMERSATGLFGVRSHAISINGFVRGDDGLSFWVARRAETKATYPGELDLMVGGGHPAGLTLRENLVKECHEEAGVPENLAKAALPVGGISFCSEQCGQVINQFQFIYDLELPADFTPRNVDGEVDSFALWPMKQVMETLCNTDEFMFDSALVMIDFLIRHGVIDNDHPDYSALVLGLRSPPLL